MSSDQYLKGARTALQMVIDMIDLGSSTGALRKACEFIMPKEEKTDAQKAEEERIESDQDGRKVVAKVTLWREQKTGQSNDVPGRDISMVISCASDDDARRLIRALGRVGVRCIPPTPLSNS